MKPSISFVIPAFNEAQYIDDCIRSIVSVCNDRISYELIVVDNGSTDNTAKLAKMHTEHVYTIGRSSVSMARNFGASKAQNEIIAFIDGDVVITDIWGETLIQHYAGLIQQQDFVTGSPCSVPSDGTWIEKNWFSRLTDQYLGGANLLTSKKVFDELSGFDETLKTGEDYDFCLRAIRQKIHFLKNSNFKAIHLGFPKNLRSFLRREYWHGEGDFKSFARFGTSLVAQISLLYVVCQLFILVAVACQQYLLAVSVLVLLVSMNFSITFKRCHGGNVKSLILNSWLNYLYFCARAASCYRAFANRNLGH